MREEILIRIAKIILQHVKGHKGLQSEICRMAGINNNKFNEMSLGKIYSSTLLWIFLGFAMWDFDDFQKMIDEIVDVIYECQLNYDMSILKNNPLSLIKIITNEQFN